MFQLSGIHYILRLFRVAAFRSLELLAADFGLYGKVLQGAKCNGVEQIADSLCLSWGLDQPRPAATDATRPWF